MTNEHDNFPELDRLGLSASKPAFEAGDVTGEFTAKNRRDPKRFKPFPVDCLPPIFRRYTIEKSAEIGQDPAGVALTLLAQAGAHVGAAVQLRMKNRYTVPPILWVCLLSMSGGRKSPTLNAGTSLVVDVEQRYFEEYLDAKKEYTRDMKAYNQSARKKDKGQDEQPPEDPPEEPKRKKVFLSGSITVEGVCKDVGANRKGLVIIFDELFQLFSDISRNPSGSSSLYLSGFNGAPINISRKTTEEVFLKKPFWSIIGAIVPEQFKAAIYTDNRLSDGTLSRFCLNFPPIPENRDFDAEVSEGTFREIKSVFERLLSVDFQDDGNPLFVFPDESIKEHWKRWQQEQEAAWKKARDNTEAAFISKSTEMLPRVALILHLLKAAENPQYRDIGNGFQGVDQIEIPPILTLETWEEAEAITRWIINETWEVYRLLGFTIDTEELTRDEKDVLTAIQNSKRPLTPSAIANQFAESRFRKEHSDRLEEVLESLTARGYIIAQTVKNPGNRKTSIYYRAK